MRSNVPGCGRLCAWSAAAVMAGLSVIASAGPDGINGRGSGGDRVPGVNPRQPHDFSDSYYRANGIEPTRLVGRPTGTGPASTLDATAPDSRHTRVRMLEHSDTWDSSGHPWFFTVQGIVFPNTFTQDAAGQRARQIAESFRLYDFPRAANPQFATFPKRQEAVSDFSGGYFSNNPLGIWKIMHVRYTPAAFSTEEGRRRLDDLRRKNGNDADGTPLIKTKSEIESLQSRGLVTVTAIPTDGSAGPPWFLCPVLEDPRDGAIASDAHLTQALRADGTANPGEVIFKTTFDSLQRTGRFP